ERPNHRLHVDRSDAILLALLDREGDHETVPGGIEFRDRGDDAHVDETVLEVEPAQQLAISLDPVRIVDIAGLQEREKPAGLRGLDDVPEPIGVIGLIADELDEPDAGLYALGNLEHEIDAVVRQLDDLRLDANVETSAAAVHFDDAGGVGLHDGTRERAAFLRLDFRLELLVLDLLVALESDAVDDRIFRDRDDQPPALDAGTDVLEKTRGDQRLDAFIDFEGTQLPIRPWAEIGADGVSLDPLIALHNDGADDGRLSIGRARGERHDATTQCTPPEDEAREAKPSNKPLTKFHSPTRPLSFPFGHLTNLGTARERSSLAHNARTSHAARTDTLTCCVTQPYYFTPEKLQSPYDAVHWAARWRRSLYVAKIINMTTIASPIRNPTS